MGKVIFAVFIGFGHDANDHIGVGSPQLSFRTKNELVYSALREAILTGDIQPGSPLVISALAERFGISETPLREALRQLAAEGLVTIVPHVGARVSLPSPVELGDMLAVQLTLELMAIRLCAEKYPNVLLDELGEFMSSLDACISSGDVAGYGRLNRAFHLKMYDACGNGYLVKLISETWDKTDWARMVFRLTTSRMESSQEEHRALIEALRVRNADEAASILKRHKETSLNAFLEYLKDCSS